MALLSSLTSFASGYSACESHVLASVESEILSSGGKLSSIEGYSNYDVKYLGDGFFDVNYLVWSEDQMTSENATFEVVIDASCNPIDVVLIQ
ncbi:hypothetical protein [Bacteriovorax sp. DB6_IX]|uniref:hypothetical protein n=1 Tax=Bacteriovorax sp. DB6_IX TaxID=1353530 RepID=UPI000558FB53|nr:hypothetical protein [Bacteriovorax sp. DB6_IX]